MLPQWRDRNLVENLVANCMEAFKRDSMKLIGIDLESDKNTDVNQTAQMLRLYNFEKVAEMIVVDRNI